MKREWKPGDVALVTGPSRMITLGLDDKKHLTALCRRENDVWIALGLDPRRGFTDAEVTSASPSHLVVIDPEDREQVERLHQSILRVYRQQKVTDAADNTTLTQAALREFANPTPPKPEVYEHIVVAGPRGPRTSICGKVWEPSEHVTVVGKCPECVAQAARWVA